MSRHRCLILKILPPFILMKSTASSAEKSFNSSQKLYDDSRAISLKAMDMPLQTRNSE